MNRDRKLCVIQKNWFTLGSHDVRKKDWVHWWFFRVVVGVSTPFSPRSSVRASPVGTECARHLGRQIPVTPQFTKKSYHPDTVDQTNEIWWDSRMLSERLTTYMSHKPWHTGTRFVHNESESDVFSVESTTPRTTKIKSKLSFTETKNQGINCINHNFETLKNHGTQHRHQCPKY